MRIAHLTTAHPPRDNRIFNKECSALAAAGIDVTLIAQNAGTGTENGVHLEALAPTTGRLQRLVLGQVRAWQALGRVRPDVVHVHDPEAIPTVMAWKLVHGAAAVYDAHEDLIGQIDDKPYMKPAVRVAARVYGKLILTLADRCFDGIVAATPVIRALYRNPNTAVVRNFPWLKDFPDVAERQPRPGHVVYVGGLTQGRQSDIMLDAIEASGATATIAGVPDAPTKARLDQLPADGPIDFLGRVNPDQIPGILATGAIGLVFLEPLPNYRESLPTKLFEYMAAGIPFIASDFPYWRELLEEHDAGIFVDSTSPEAPTEALRELIADPERARAMGQRGRRAIEQVFNFENDVDALVELEQRAARGRRRRR